MSPETAPSPEPDSPTELASLSVAPRAFPQSSRFPAEIQILIWEQYILIERDNRVVFVANYRGLSYDRWRELRRANIPEPQGLRILPSRCLVSPLLSVSSQSRAVALGHYRTRIELFEQGSPFHYGLTGDNEEPEEIRAREARKDSWVRPYRERGSQWSPGERRNCIFPKHPEWYRRETRVNDLDHWTTLAASYVWEEDRVDPAAHRGCVYLDLATDRFLNWYCGEPRIFKAYGRRVLSDALLDFKYHAIPFDLKDVLARRRPAPLQYFSEGLSAVVLDKVRHLVFADNPGGVRTKDGRALVEPKRFRKLCPRALGPGGTIWSFPLSDGMLRTINNDVDDKGAEHLLIRKVKTEFVSTSRSFYREALALDPWG
ncbi:uncharacterized protein PG986_008445 [Apiospora aurea]|uniref:2EXR domain-containing protein n=1 Tax=Apiospora aurea TaxID=335848 RepID=A0ABR1QFH7_9PEZI